MANHRRTWRRVLATAGVLASVLAGPARSATAVQRPAAAQAPLPDYDVRAGYIGWPDLADPWVRREWSGLRRAQAALVGRSARAPAGRPGESTPAVPGARNTRTPTPDRGIAGAGRSGWHPVPPDGQRVASLLALFAGGARIALRDDGTLRQLSGETAPLAPALPGDAVAGARAFLTRFGGPLFGLDPAQAAALEVARTLTSPAGVEHVDFRQTIGGVPILGADLKVSLSALNEPLMVGGRLYPGLRVAGSPILTPVDAVLAAATHAGPAKREAAPARSITVADWQRVRHVDSWTPDGLARARRDPGPLVLRATPGPEQRTWLTRGPFRGEVMASLVVFPLSPLEGRWAWSIVLARRPAELYRIVVDAATGDLLRRRNLVKFASLEGTVFEDSPDAGPPVVRSFAGTPPATPASETFVDPAASGLQGNNVLLTPGASEKPGTDRDFTHGWADAWATGGAAGLVPFDLDAADRRLEFTRLSATSYTVARVAGSLVPPVGVNLMLGDDTAVCGPAPTGFTYYDLVEPTVCVNSNGNVTFNGPATGFTEDPTFEFLDASDGRVMGLWDDLNPAAGGTVSMTSVPATSLCFRWNSVPQFADTDANTFGICLFSSGLIRLSYPLNGVAAEDGGVGIHPPTRPCAGRGSAVWHDFAGPLTTTGSLGMSRFFPDTGPDARVSATTVFFHLNDGGHDRHWFNGFDEPAGNFQVDNLGRGGAGCDPVVAAVNPPQFFNNAFFGTPPDGVCCPFTAFGKFTAPFPDRESAVDRDVVLHEFGHGVTTRLVGGPGDVSLFGTESGALGEGWGDFFAINAGDDVMGEYATGNPTTGIRRVRYEAGNGRRYDQFGQIFGPMEFPGGDGPFFVTAVHDDGEIWASALHSVRAALTTSAFKDKPGGLTRAEVEALVVEALSFTPSHPTMPDARNALLVADLVAYGGAHRCGLWRAFAARGLGVHAAPHPPGVGLDADLALSAFGSADTPATCGGAFELGPVIHQASFESAAVGALAADGWQSVGGTSLWHVTARRASDGTRAFYYGQEGSGTYDVGRTWGNLRSPVLDLAGVSHPILEFDVAADVEADAAFDTLRVRVVGSDASGNAQRAVQARPTPDFFGRDFFQFVHLMVDLTPIANTTTNRIEFSFDTGDDTDNAHEGVYVDNIRIRASVQQ